MTYRGFLSRADIGLRSPKSRSTNIDASRIGSLSHWAGPAQGIGSHAECLSTWRGFQRYHMDVKNWVDIAYTLGVCDHGYVLAGRGAGVRTAANGTNEANYGAYAICWIGGSGETPTKDAIDAFWAARKMLMEDGGASSGVGKHSDYRSTTCSGSFGTAIANSSPSETDMADHDHDLTEMPDWGGAEQRFWDKFVGDGVTSAPDSWKRSVHRLDLAWIYSKVIVPLQDRIKALEDGAGGAGAHVHDERYVQKSDYDNHRHDEGRTSGPR